MVDVQGTSVLLLCFTAVATLVAVALARRSLLGKPVWTVVFIVQPIDPTRMIRAGGPDHALRQPPIPARGRAKMMIVSLQLETILFRLLAAHITGYRNVLAFPRGMSFAPVFRVPLLPFARAAAIVVFIAHNLLALYDELFLTIIAGNHDPATLFPSRIIRPCVNARRLLPSTLAHTIAKIRRMAMDVVRGFKDVLAAEPTLNRNLHNKTSLIKVPDSQRMGKAGIRRQRFGLADQAIPIPEIVYHTLRFTAIQSGIPA